MAKSIGKKVYPKYPEKYYVYILRKPTGGPFYVGKGIGSRVNDHFYPSNLEKNNHKNKTIKKYGEGVVRDIVKYFEDEVSAYDYEEYLIGLYGIQREGGILTNTLKSVRDTNPDFLKVYSKKGRDKNTVRISNHTIFLVFKRLLFEGKPSCHVATEFNLSRGMVFLILQGKKNPQLYNKYIASGLIRDRRLEHNPTRKGIPQNWNKRYTDEELVLAFDSYRFGIKTSKQLSSELGIGYRHLNNIFSGAHRKSLNLSSKKIYLIKRSENAPCVNTLSERYKDYINNNLTINQIIEKYDMSKPSVLRLIKFEGAYRGVRDYIKDFNICCVPENK